jgi:hypothetical protein
VKRIAESLAAETQRLREAGLLPERVAPARAASRCVSRTAWAIRTAPSAMGSAICASTFRSAFMKSVRAEFGKLYPATAPRPASRPPKPAKLRMATGMDDLDLALGWGQLYRTPGSPMRSRPFARR